MEYDVFISYSRKDTAIVNQFVDRLTEAGYRVWIDRDGIYSGDHFKAKIVRAIKDSAIVLYFSSANSNASEWTVKEISYSLKKGKTIIPVKLDGAEYEDSIDFDLVNVDFIQYQPNQVLSTLDRLITSLAKHLSKEPFTSLSDLTSNQSPIEQTPHHDDPENNKKAATPSRNAITESDNKAFSINGTIESEAKTLYNVYLLSPGSQPIQVIKQIMTLFHIGVKSAFDLVNSFPVAIKKNVTKFEADLLENELMSLGATIEIVTAEEDERNSIHSVILMEHGPNTVSLVATISMLLNISLTDAKGLVDKADKTPVILKERVNFFEAMSFKRLIEGYDAKIEVKTNVDK